MSDYVSSVVKFLNDNVEYLTEKGAKKETPETTPKPTSPPKPTLGDGRTVPTEPKNAVDELLMYYGTISKALSDTDQIKVISINDLINHGRAGQKLKYFKIDDLGIYGWFFDIKIRYRSSDMRLFYIIGIDPDMFLKINIDQLKNPDVVMFHSIWYGYPFFARPKITDAQVSATVLDYKYRIMADNPLSMNDMVNELDDFFDILKRWNVPISHDIDATRVSNAVISGTIAKIKAEQGGVG